MATGKKVYNVAIVGCGAFSKHAHIPGIEVSPRLRLYAAVTRRPETAEALQQQYDLVYACNDEQRVLDDPEVDLVIIATRHDLHPEQIARAARAGKAILAEKPLALSVEACDRVVAIVAETQVPFAVGLNRRSSPFSQPIRACLASASRPVMAEYHWFNAPWGLSWAFDPNQGGGKLVSSGCHMFDYLHYLLGTEPVRVFARGGRFRYGEQIETLDTAAVLVEYADGSVASVTTGEFGHADYPQERLTFFTDRGVIEMEDFVRMRASGFDAAPIELPKQEKGFARQLEAMVELMEGRSTELADARAGRMATAVAVAATRAVSTGQVQPVPA